LFVRESLPRRAIKPIAETALVEFSHKSVVDKIFNMNVAEAHSDQGQRSANDQQNDHGQDS
jgi:hypothetical protein